jgi:hypothetical protein
MKLTDNQRMSLEMVLDMAIENSCSCGDEERNDHKGYLDHDTDCWVNRERKYLKTIQKMLDKE